MKTVLYLWLMNSLIIHPIKTKIFRLGEDLNQFLTEEVNRFEDIVKSRKCLAQTPATNHVGKSDHSGGHVLENKIIAITSKIVSVAEGRLIPKKEIEKSELIQREADVYLGKGGHNVELTIKHGMVIPSAGIDESNSESGHYILYPEKPYESARKIYEALKEKFNLNNFGVLITDSHTLPLRQGVTGIALSHWGFKATASRIGQTDLFGRPLAHTYIDVIDALAAMAVYVMGEADESVPVAILENSNVKFTDKTSSAEIAISLENDIYYPLLKDRKK